MNSVQSILKISGSEADKIIRLWEEFGASYFELAQLIRISPEGYRAIEPAVKDGALHHEGEAIELMRKQPQTGPGSDGTARREPAGSQPEKRRGSARCMRYRGPRPQLHEVDPGISTDLA